MVLQLSCLLGRMGRTTIVVFDERMGGTDSSLSMCGTIIVVFYGRMGGTTRVLKIVGLHHLCLLSCYVVGYSLSDCM